MEYVWQMAARLSLKTNNRPAAKTFTNVRSFLSKGLLKELFHVILKSLT